ncbi:hypothetical protein [Candidatus Nitrososphaera evergladensis]|nr:hypothetical protein [Candidatus Nitrososphaera evergladensis]
MKDWHLEHIEKVAVKFARGLASTATYSEKRNHKKFGTATFCIKQIEYDMKHGVEKSEVMEVFRKIRLDEKYAKLWSNVEALNRLQELEDRLLLTGGQEIVGAAAKDDRFLWHKNAYKG